MPQIDQEPPSDRSYTKTRKFGYPDQHTTAAMKGTRLSGPDVGGLSINGSYISEANRQLTSLGQAVGQDKATLDKLLQALRFSGGEWCQNAIPQKLDIS